MARTKYQALVHSKSDFCHGKVLKSDVKRHASTYVHDAVIKATKKAPKSADNAKVQAKARKEAQKIANRVLRAGCKISSVIAGKKKKKGAKRRGRKRK